MIIDLVQFVKVEMPNQAVHVCIYFLSRLTDKVFTVFSYRSSKYRFFLSLLEVPQIFVLIKNNFVRHDTKTASGSQSDLAIESTQSSEAKTTKPFSVESCSLFQLAFNVHLSCTKPVAYEQIKVEIIKWLYSTTSTFN